MPNITMSREIAASPELVWEKFSDLRLYDKWMTLHQSWKSDVPEKVSQGAQVTEVVSIIGMANTINWTVEEYEELKKLKLSGSGMAGAQISLTASIEPAGAGTKISFDAEFSGQTMVGAIGKAVTKAAGEEIDESLSKFEALLDA